MSTPGSTTEGASSGGPSSAASSPDTGAAVRDLPLTGATSKGRLKALRPRPLEPKPQLCTVIPLWLPGGSTDFPAARLAQALVTQGWNTSVMTGDPANAAQVTELAAHHDVVLMAVPFAHANRLQIASRWGSVVLAVPTRREGVQAAYLQIKALHQGNIKVPVGIIMVDADRQESAAGHFHKLAAGCARFLEVNLRSYGYLPAPPSPYAAVNLQPDAPERVALDGVASLIGAELLSRGVSPMKARS